MVKQANSKGASARVRTHKLGRDPLSYSLLWSLAPYGERAQADPWEVSVEGERQQSSSAPSAEHSLGLRFSLLPMAGQWPTATKKERGLRFGLSCPSMYSLRVVNQVSSTPILDQGKQGKTPLTLAWGLSKPDGQREDTGKQPASCCSGWPDLARRGGGGELPKSGNHLIQYPPLPHKPKVPS